MKKTYLAASIAALLTASASTQAVQVFKDSKNTVDIGGWLDITTQMRNSNNENINGDLDMIDNSSRINFVIGHDLGNGWNGSGVLEYGVNPVGSHVITGEGATVRVEETEGTSGLRLRLGNINIGKDKIGTFTIGKSWGVYYDIAGATDNPHIWSDVFGVYGFETDGGELGTGRADKVIQYRNQMGGFQIGLQVQPHVQKNDDPNYRIFVPGGVDDLEYLEYGPGYGISLRYNMDKFGIGFAYNSKSLSYTTDPTKAKEYETDKDLTDSIMGISLTYGDYDTNGLYAAFVYSSSENHSILEASQRLTPKATAMEFNLAFKTDVVRPYLGYYQRTLEKTDEVLLAGRNLKSIDRSTLAVGLDVLIGDDVTLYGEYAMMMDYKGDPELTSKEEDAEKDDFGGIGFGVQYIF